MCQRYINRLPLTRPQPSHVPWLGVKPLATFQFAGWCSVRWATPARHKVTTFKVLTMDCFNYFYLFVFREKRREGEKEGEKHWWEIETSISCLLYMLHPSGDWTHNPEMCRDQELNQQPFALWEGTHQTEPHWSGLGSSFLMKLFYL